MTTKDVGPAGEWLSELRPSHGTAAGTATLVILPHSGSSADSYRDWRQWFPSDVRLVAAQYPGRGTRYGQPYATDIQSLADPLAEALAQLPGHLHVFGHSLGALLGFEVCWRLQRADRPVAAFYPSAAWAPHVHPGRECHAPAMTDDELIADLRDRGGVPEDILAEPELLDLVMETCRADMAITGSYDYGSEQRLLECRLVAFGGDEDTIVPVPRLKRWPEVCAGVGDVRVFAGGHFYLLDHMAELTATIRSGF
ncbi:thioesterase II family protein [Streptomyces goshikiensis]|uniref:thioesterase II family protein n=1 Tax=Streptomyces goshikiensis TaxID=1942 RepID=UPI0036C58E40